MSTTRDPGTDQAAPLPAPAGVVGAHDAVIRRMFGYRGAVRTPATRVAIDVMLCRQALGLRKYGTVLHPGDGRDHLRDLIEELADAVAYAECLDDATTRDTVTGCLLEVLRHWEVTQWPLEDESPDSLSDDPQGRHGAPVSLQNERTDA